MKAITNSELLPKMLRVNSDITKASFNKFLPQPFVDGELVKVNSEQQPSSQIKMSTADFQKRYVSVIRKDVNGAWTVINSLDWRYFDKLNKK
jgi:hypothetical protein